MEAKGEEEIQVVVKEPTDPCMFNGDSSSYLFLDHSIRSFTSFGPKNDSTHLHNPKLSSVVVDSQLSSEDSDSVDDEFSNNDDEGCVDDDVNGILYDEKVKMKLHVLAAMVGITRTASPGVVLGEVVRVLKELGQEREHANGINHNKRASN